MAGEARATRSIKRLAALGLALAALVAAGCGEKPEPDFSTVETTPTVTTPPTTPTTPTTPAPTTPAPTP